MRHDLPLVKPSWLSSITSSPSLPCILALPRGFALWSSPAERWGWQVSSSLAHSFYTNEKWAWHCLFSNHQGLHLTAMIIQVSLRVAWWLSLWLRTWDASHWDPQTYGCSSSSGSHKPDLCLSQEGQCSFGSHIQNSSAVCRAVASEDWCKKFVEFLSLFLVHC